MESRSYILMIYAAAMLMGRIVAQGQRGREAGYVKQHRGALRAWDVWLVSLAGGLAVLLPVLEAARRPVVGANLYISAAGLAIISAGWSIATAANHAIGKNWSPTIDKDDEQQLITSGIYSLVRHPLYLSGLVTLLGTNIYFQSTWGWAGLAPVLAAILVRIPIEEQRLMARFGERYRVYRNRTKAVIPGIL